MSASERPYFSIVVPCCGVGRYVAEVVDSLLGQDFADWECILSYEESSDDTWSVCEEMTKRDSRIRLVNCGPRSGSPATPRNRAFEQVCGEYVIWVDGDDYLADGALATLAKGIRAAPERPDLVQGVIVEFFEALNGVRTFKAREFNFTPEEDGNVYTGVDALYRILQHKYVWPMVTLSICRSDFLREKKIRFCDGLVYEDEEWTPRVLALAEHVLVLNFEFYHYRRREGSVTRTTDENRRLEHYASVARSQFLFFAAKDLPAKVARVVARYYIDRFLEVFFEPHPVTTPVSPPRLTQSLRRLLADGGRAALWKLARHESLAKRLGVALLMLAGIRPALDLPARAYLNLYYRFVIWRVRTRGY